MQKSKSHCVCPYWLCHFVFNIWEEKSPEPFQRKTCIPGLWPEPEARPASRNPTLLTGASQWAWVSWSLVCLYMVPRFQRLLTLVVRQPFPPLASSAFPRARVPSHICQTDPRWQSRTDPASDIGAKVESNYDPVENRLLSFLVTHERRGHVMHQGWQVKMSWGRERRRSRAIGQVGQVLGHTCILGEAGWEAQCPHQSTTVPQPPSAAARQESGVPRQELGFFTGWDAAAPGSWPEGPWDRSSQPSSVSSKQSPKAGRWSSAPRDLFGIRVYDQDPWLGGARGFVTQRLLRSRGGKSSPNDHRPRLAD